MKKKFVAVILSSLLCVSILAGCGGGNNNTTNTPSNNNTTTNNTVQKDTAQDEVALNSKYEKIQTDLKVGMATDSGTIDDRSFNQNTWEGIEGSIENCKYLRPSGETDADYLESIGNLYDAGYHFIVLPGYKFERAVHTAQAKYQDAKFVILDGTAVDESGAVANAENTVAVLFAEEEGGFIAGVAAAVQIKEGDFGFIGGMTAPAVLDFEYGFQQGIEYANANLGTNVTLKSENVVYQGSFNDKAGGQQVAAQMYDRGVKVIFTAAGGTGIGAITEAKSRAANGDTSVYIIGVDVDQYADGIYNTDTNASVILTSAMKYMDKATIAMIQDELNGKFQGGQTLTFTVANNGVGIPPENPNLSSETMQVVEKVINDIKSGTIEIRSKETV